MTCPPLYNCKLTEDCSFQVMFSGVEVLHQTDTDPSTLSLSKNDRQVQGARGLNSRVRCWILIEWTILGRLAVIRSFSDEYLSSNRLWYYCLIWCCSCLIWGGGWSTLIRNFLRCSPFCLKAPKKISEKIGIFFPQKGHRPRQFIFRAPLSALYLFFECRLPLVTATYEMSPSCCQAMRRDADLRY